jgi:hypothetical protein
MNVISPSARSAELGSFASETPTLTMAGSLHETNRGFVANPVSQRLALARLLRGNSSRCACNDGSISLNNAGNYPDNRGLPALNCSLTVHCSLVAARCSLTLYPLPPQNLAQNFVLQRQVIVPYTASGVWRGDSLCMEESFYVG